MHTFLPPPPFRGRFVGRTIVTWVFLRATAVIGATSMGVLYADLEGAARPNALPLGSPWLGLVLAVVVAGVILGDMVRRSELIFLANLGWSPHRLAAGALLVCALMEAAVQVIRVW